jgi:hypothetical protein
MKSLSHSLSPRFRHEGCKNRKQHAKVVNRGLQIGSGGHGSEGKWMLDLKILAKKLISLHFDKNRT